jgi:hypothetical protein
LFIDSSIQNDPVIKDALKGSQKEMPEEHFEEEETQNEKLSIESSFLRYDCKFQKGKSGE